MASVAATYISFQLKDVSLCNWNEVKQEYLQEALKVSVEGCKFVQLKLELSNASTTYTQFQLKDVSLCNWNPSANPMKFLNFICS